MKQILDFTTDIQIDMMINKNRDLNSVLHCVYVDKDGNEQDFNFDVYDTAIMHVKNKPNDDYVVLTLSTISDSIIFEGEGRIRFKLEAEDTNKRAGEYYYDIYLYGDNWDKRQLMSGKFIINNTITN